MQKISTAFHVFKNTTFPFSLSFKSMLPFKSVFTSASTAFTKFSSVCVGFKYGVSMQSVAMSKNNQTGDAVADIFKFHFCALFRTGQFIRIFILQCLYACHFIRRNDMATIMAGLLCIAVYFAYFILLSGQRILDFLPFLWSRSSTEPYAVVNSPH